MPKGPIVRVEGAARLRRTLKKAGSDLSDMKRVHAAVAGFVATRARSTAPHRSGALGSSVRGNKAAASAVVKAGGAKVPYAGPIHYGWPARGISPQPFLSDAATATEPTWLEFYMTEMDRILGQVKGA